MNVPKLIKKMFTAGVILAMALSVAGCGEEKGESVVNIATGGTAGAYYPIGNAISEIINKNVEGVTSSAQSTGASVANINMLAEGQIEMAIVQNDIAYYAVNGQNMFDKKCENLRGIASLYPETFQFVTTVESGIMTVEDLKGKRVAVGVKGSGVEANVRQILQVYDLSYDDIDEQFLSFAEAANALKDGTIDVACVTAGYPTPSVQDVAAQKNIRIIPLDENKITMLTIDFPFYTRAVIPEGVYQGFDREVSTVNVMAILVATDKMSDIDGYNITRAIFNNTDKLSASHPAANRIEKKSALAGMGFIKMNDGAEKFLKEK